MSIFTKITTMRKLSILNWSVMLALICFLVSCEKKNEEDTVTEIENTIDLSAKQSVSDELADDVNDVVVKVLEDNNMVGSRPDSTTPSGCPTVNVTTTTPNAFPKTITIDFGTGCYMTGSPTYRKGVMIVTLSDSLAHTGATASVTFNNYQVDKYKKSGTIKWTNESTMASRKWKREVINVMITDTTSSSSWTHNGVKTFEELGVNTTDPTDDGFNITGNASIVNSAGISRSSAILTPVHKFKNCDHCDRGTIKYIGPNHTAVLDFGNGTCDDQATLTIDGSIVRNITLQ